MWRWRICFKRNKKSTREPLSIWEWDIMWKCFCVTGLKKYLISYLQIRQIVFITDDINYKSDKYDRDFFFRKKNNNKELKSHGWIKRPATDNKLYFKSTQYYKKIPSFNRRIVHNLTMRMAVIHFVKVNVQ